MRDHLQTWKLFNNPRNTSPRLHLLPWLPDWDQTSWEAFPYFNRTCKWCEKNTWDFCFHLWHRALFSHCALSVYFYFYFFLLAAIQLWSQSCSTRRPACTEAQWRRWWGSAGQWCDRSLRSNCLHTNTNPVDCRCQRNEIELKKCEKIMIQSNESIIKYLHYFWGSLTVRCLYCFSFRLLLQTPHLLPSSHSLPIFHFFSPVHRLSVIHPTDSSASTTIRDSPRNRCSCSFGKTLD